MKIKFLQNQGLTLSIEQTIFEKELWIVFSKLFYITSRLIFNEIKDLSVIWLIL